MDSHASVSAVTFLGGKEIPIEGVSIDLLAFDGKVAFIEVGISILSSLLSVSVRSWQ